MAIRKTILIKEKMSKAKKESVQQINLTPISNNMITTANLAMQTTKFVLKEKPTFLNIQQVLAIGPRVEDVKVGDWVYIDLERYNKHVKVQSTIKAGIGGQDMIKEEFVPPIFIAPGETGAYFKITDREIEGVIKDHSKLPKLMKEFMTVESYEKAVMENMEKSEEAKVKMDEEIAARNMMKKVEENGVDAPAIFAEGKFKG